MSDKWILASDKLPQYFGRYWITVKLGNQYITAESGYNARAKGWVGSIPPVIAWQEQPAPYTPDRKGKWRLTKDGMPPLAAKYWVTTDHSILTTADLLEEFGSNLWNIDIPEYRSQKVIAWQEYEVPDPYVPTPLKLYLVTAYGYKSVTCALDKQTAKSFIPGRESMKSCEEIGIANPNQLPGIINSDRP